MTKLANNLLEIEFHFITIACNKSTFCALSNCSNAELLILVLIDT